MKLVPRHIEYAGVLDPRTPDDMEIEIYGLRNAINQAQELISRYDQAIAMARLAIRHREENAHVVEPGLGGDTEEAGFSSQEKAEE